jgi:arylsulfatase A-like enzyme
MTRRRFLASAGLAAGTFALFRRARTAEEAREKLNVLFIAVDDLRPELGCYGHPKVKSPNIDRLAARGMVFRRAYCQQAVSSPSRTSLLTGLRPDSTRVYDLRTHFRKHVPDVVTLPQHFKNHGYHSQAFGKIYHGAFMHAHIGGKLDDPPSWSVPSWRGGPRYYYTPEGVRIARERFKPRAKKLGVPVEDWTKHFVRGLPTEAPEVPDSTLYDGQVAERGVQALRKLKDRPFFLALGFIKPHLPFVAPKRYWDLYDRSKIDLADNPFTPKGAPRLARTNWGELRAYHGVPRKGPVSDALARTLIHGYRACVSFVDAQIGRVLDELGRLGLRDRTLVVLWGDHGWKLGEHGMWCKHTNFELDARAPLILRAPGMKAAGEQTDALVEFVDIYPTLAELAGLSLPKHLEGASMVPLLAEPGRPWKSAAFSQYPRGRTMGTSMRTDRYRLTVWHRRNAPEKVVATELYDHTKDPAENANVAGEPAYADTVAVLRKRLRAGWRAARPE